MGGGLLLHSCSHIAILDRYALYCCRYGPRWAALGAGSGAELLQEVQRAGLNLAWMLREGCRVVRGGGRPLWPPCGLDYGRSL